MERHSSGALPPPHELLGRFLRLKKERNPRYSARALARDLGVAASYVSGLLAGKKNIPVERLGEIARALGMDEIAFRMLKRAILQAESEKLAFSLGLAKETKKRRTKKKEVLDDFKEVSQPLMRLLERWYMIAVMDLVTCDNFEEDPRWIAERLGIAPHEARTALEDLKANGLIEKRLDRWVKCADKIRLPTHQSLPLVRGFHNEMIKRAQRDLRERTDHASFSRRSITGLTIAANPANLERARHHLLQAIYECAEILTEGPCTEVYQLNSQLFPLTR